jgi:cytochrome c
MLIQKKLLIALAGFLCTVSVFYACNSTKPQATAGTGSSAPALSLGRLLVFAKTAGYHHESIADGLVAIQKLGSENHFGVDTTTNAAYFTDASLKQYAAVVFLSTTMDVLNADQQVALERFIQAGGGYAGVHAAADTEYDWPWYNKLVGAYFLSHPKQQKAVIDVRDKNHPSTSFLPDQWDRFDEWYNYKSIMPDIHVLATLDEKTYEGGKNGDNHPIAWYHEVDGGRAWYTGLGHTKESYREALFLQHLLGGIKYAIGNNKLDYSKSYAVRPTSQKK